MKISEALLSVLFLIQILVGISFQLETNTQEGSASHRRKASESTHTKNTLKNRTAASFSGVKSTFQGSTNFIAVAKWSAEAGNKIKVYPKPGKSFVPGVGKGDAYTDQELRSITQLRQRLEKVLTLEYMLLPGSLIRFLRVKRMDVDAAEEMIHKLLEWRKAEKIDEFRPEDFVWWERNVPFYFMLDKDGRPGLVSGIRGLSLRAYVLAGKAQDVMRYIYYALEMSTRFAVVHSKRTGIEYNNGNLVFSLQGYTDKNHACLGCIPYLLQIARTYENYYPETGGRIIGVNAPRIFQNALDLVRPILSATTLRNIRLYGFDKAEWQGELLKIFPAENLTPEFGGTRNLTERQGASSLCATDQGVCPSFRPAAEQHSKFQSTFVL